ncbi:hypothetical protein C8F01DRAFT_1376817 [Mycena amicta]|nr:hypothetical protein C8F01DRAFT_1376817 [Mycena amicta]
MHRALEIPEVLRRICSHIALVEVGSGYIHVDLLDESKTALAQIARTSKGLSKHALDELWMTQDTLENLLKCMQGLWDASTGNPLRPLLREDIECVNHYACRVKYFPCLEPDDLTAFARVLGHFRAALGHDLLFPNLRSLRIVFGTSAILSEISTLLSPKLKYIELGIFEEDSDYSLLPTISSACPLLTHVSISEADRSDGKHLSLWSDFICGLHHLQFAACMPVDYAALKHLAHWGLPLKQITITHMTAEAIAALERSEDPAAWELPEDEASWRLAEEERFQYDVNKFRSLKTLGIASDATCIAEFFRAWTDSASGYLDASLEDIDFDIFPSPTYESLREVYYCLSDIEPGQSFTSLAISVPLPPPQRDMSETTTPKPRSTSLIQHFRCLESCRLSILNLTPPDNYEFDDYDVRCLGKFCYYLTSVTLHRARGPYPPLATVNALTTLAERCRFLTTLVLSINVQTEDIEEFFKEYEQPPVEEMSRSFLVASDDWSRSPSTCSLSSGMWVLRSFRRTRSSGWLASSRRSFPFYRSSILQSLAQRRRKRS